MLILIEERTYRRAAQIVLGVLTVVVLLTFRHYGISWDEEIQSQYGQAILDYYASLFVDHRYKEIFNLYLYGGMFDGLAAYFNAYTPVKIYETRHLLNALFGLLGLWGTWRLGNFIERGQVGLVALILLALTPMYYGHMFNNPKDIPFAAGVVWTLYYMAKTMRIFPRLSPQLIIKLGIFLGLTLGIRVGGVMLLGYWGLALLLQSRFRNIKALIGLVAPVTLLAYTIMLICWPWAQESPFTHPFEALLTFSNFPQDVEVLLDGTTYRSTQLPWYYLPLYFLVQLPLLHLFLIASGLLTLSMSWRGINGPGQRSAFVLVLLTAFVPPLFAIIHHSALYDAVRHFIFVLPLLCLIAALGLRQLLSIFRHSLKKIKTHEVRQFLMVGFILLIGIVMLFQIKILRQLHPYEYIYVNALNGACERRIWSLRAGLLG